MEISKIELNLGQKSINPFRTTRKSDTNPFKYQDFEGNTIDPLICADVLVSFKGKENKLKMIASSVIGSVTKLRNSIPEHIVNFANRVKDGITGAWAYAKNTEIKLAGLDNISSRIHDIMSYDVGKGITDSISILGKNMSDWRLGVSDKWNELIEKVNLKNIGHEKISSDLPVATLRELLINELAKQTSAKEIAIDSAHKMEAKVA